MVVRTRKSIVGDSALAVATSLVVVCATVALTGLLARVMSKDDYEGYLMIRRFLAIAFPLTTLSLGVGLAHSVASHASRPLMQKRLLAGTLVIACPMSILTLSTAWIAPAAFAAFFFPGIDSCDEHVWKAVVLWLASYTGFNLLYSYYSGTLNMMFANTVNIMANAVAPIVIFVALQKSDNLTLSNFVTLWAIVYALAFADCLGRASKALRQLPRSVVDAWRNVVPYSLPRLPGGFLLASNLFMAPYFMSKAGLDILPVLNGMLAAQAVHFLTDPIGSVLMPRTAMMSQEPSRGALRNLCGKNFDFFLQAACFAVPMTVAVGPSLSMLWFGVGGGRDSGLAIQYLSLCVAAALLYTPSRSILDGIERKALNTWHLLASSSFCAAALAALWLSGRLTLLTACLCLAAAQGIVAILNIAAIYRRISFKIDVLGLWECAILGCLCAGGVFCLSRVIDGAGSFRMAAAICAAAAVSGLTFAAWAILRRPSWLDAMLKKP